MANIFHKLRHFCNTIDLSDQGDKGRIRIPHKADVPKTVNVCAWREHDRSTTPFTLVHYVFTEQSRIELFNGSVDSIT